MKISSQPLANSLTFFLFSFALVLSAEIPPPTPYEVVSRSANSRVWEKTIYEAGPDGEMVAKKHSYTELATGLHYLENGQWVEAREQIDILPQGGAEAIHGQHQVYFPADIYNGVIELVTPDGRHLKSRPMGISYFDGTSSVLISELKNSVGQIVGPNQIIYPDAFTDFKADLVCTYRKGGFESDLVFREQPPGPEQYGLDSQHSRLQLLTEFFDTDDPEQMAVINDIPDGISDHTLKFGGTIMGHGKAFTVNGSSTSLPNVLVAKSWLHLDGRTFLVEELPFHRISPQLGTLPAPGTLALQNSPGSVLHKVSTQRLLAPARLVQTTSTNAIHLAKADLKHRLGVVLDYVIMDADPGDFTFQADTTYFITAGREPTGHLIFEGGTVLKYDTDPDNPVLMECWGPITCDAGPYRPIIVTSRNDDTVGESISDLDFPMNYYGAFAGDSSSSTQWKYMSIRYADRGIIGNSNLHVTDSQFIHCQWPIYTYWGPCYLTNDLLVDVGTVVYGNAYDVTAYHLTVDGCNDGQLTEDWDGPGSSSVTFVNSLLVGGGTDGDATITTNYTARVGAGAIFQVAGGGNCYLTNGSPYRNIGTTNIGSALLNELRTKTTYSPIVYSNVVFTSPTNFSPVVQRDIDVPDLGYHYDPLDYVFDNATADFSGGADRMLFNQGTTAAGIIRITDNGQVTFQGLADSPCWFVGGNTVQEETNALGIGIVPFGSGGRGADARFTKLSALTGKDVYFASRTNTAGGFSALNSEFYGGNIGANSFSNAYSFSNCLFWRCRVGGDNHDSWTIKNSTFWNGSLSTSNSDFAVLNTAFDGTSISLGSMGSVAFDYNAYLTNADRLSGSAAHDLTNLASFNWQSGFFGNFYLTNTSPLINAGSTNANLLGLYHFTTQTNQVKETNSFVDIGYHYVATDSGGNPLDTNGDNIPDYLEDANGNGLVDAGETNWALAILVQPVSQTVIQGTNTTFSVTAAGIAPLSYQWTLNGTNIVGAASATLTVTNAQPTNQGLYQVIVTNFSGSLTSSIAVLALTCQSSPTGMVLWLPGNGDSYDYASTNDGAFFSSAYATGKVGQAFLLNGTNAYIEVPDSASLKPSSVTVEAWVRLDAQSSPGASLDGLQYIVFKKGPKSGPDDGGAFEGYTLLKLNISGINYFSFVVSSGGSQAITASTTTVQTNVWYHLAGTYDPAAGSAKLYVNGVLESAVSASFSLSYGTRPVFIGTTGESWWDAKFQGAIDEVSIYDRALSTNEIAAIYSADSAGKCLPPWPVPSAPTNLIAKAISPTQIGLTWDGTLNSGMTRISVERKVGSGGTYSEIARLTPAFSYIDTNLLAGTNYYYRIRLLDVATWSPYSNETNATTFTTGTDLPLGNLKLWLKADAGLVPKGTNMPVIVWADQSGGQNNALQSTIANRPAWIPQEIGGRPFIYFNATNSQFFTLPNFLNTVTGAEIVVALKASEAIPAQPRGLWFFGNSTATGWDVYPSTDGAIGNDFGSADWNFIGQPPSPLTLTQFDIFEIAAQSNYWAASLNGILLYQTNQNSISFTNNPTLGSSWVPSLAQNFYFDGDIAELLIFNRTLATNEQAVVRAYLAGKYNNAFDLNANGLPDWWELKYFGNLNEATNADYDSDGTNDLQEYNNGADPNTISFNFSLPNQYVTTSLVTGLVTVLGGVPSYYAVLVDNTNISTATWTAYTSSNLTVNLGSTPGFHDVWIGLRGIPPDAEQTWQNTTVVLDTTPPSIAVTNPVNNASFNASRIDVRGNFTSGALKQITVNGVLAFTGGTNFNAMNVPLDPGTNIIMATIEDFTGFTNAASVTVIGLTNVDGSMNEPVQLQATPVAGFSPLTVTFQVTSNGAPGTFQQALYDFNGDGIIDFVTNNLNSLTYTYTNGEYFPAVTLQTTAGNFSSSGGWNSYDPNRIQITVQNPIVLVSTISVTDPVDVKWVAPSNLYVLSGSTAILTQFSTNGSVIRSFTNSAGSSPSGFDVDAAGNVFIALTASNQVWKFYPTNSSFSPNTNFGIGGCIGLTNGTSGTDTNQFNAPYDVAVSPDGGTISVSDSGNNRIQQFSASDGIFTAAFGTNGTDVGQFNAPKGLAYDFVGTLYIADSGNSRIVLAQGHSIEAVTGTNGTALGQFNGLANISVNARGVYVADATNNRIQSFSPPVPDSLFSVDPPSIRFAVSSGLNLPAAVAAVDGPTNELFYIADTGHDRVLLYSVAMDDPLPVWGSMTNHVATADISGGAFNFSIVSANQYQQAFLSTGTANIISLISQIGTLTPVYIKNDTAEYYFQQVIAGETITFPVKFVKENGVWKILEF